MDESEKLRLLLEDHPTLGVGKKELESWSILISSVRNGKSGEKKKEGRRRKVTLQHSYQTNVYRKANNSRADPLIKLERCARIKIIILEYDYFYFLHTLCRLSKESKDIDWSARARYTLQFVLGVDEEVCPRRCAELRRNCIHPNDPQDG